MTGGRQISLDRLYVILLCAAISALAWAWQFDSPPPELMDSLAAAAGLRPPVAPLSLFWQHIAAPLCRVFGLPAACTVLRIAGHVSLGVFAFLSAGLLWMMLPASLLRGGHVASWWRVAVRFVLFQGTALLCLSDPVWNAFRWFSPLSLQILIATFAVVCCMVHFTTERRMPLFASFALIGLLAADTPIGVVMLILLVVALFVRKIFRRVGFVVTPQDFNPIVNAHIHWRLTIAFAIGLGIGMALEIGAFASLDGLAAFGLTWGDYALEFPIVYLKALLATCTPAGALIFICMSVLPMLLALNVISRATDAEKTLRYSHGVIFVMVGLVAFTQLSGARTFWFWTWGGEGGCVRDGVLRCAAAFLCTLSVVWSLAVFTIELYLRNFRRIGTLQFQDDVEDEGVSEALAAAKRLQRIVRAFLLAEPVIMFACVLPFRVQGLERAMLGAMADAARETADECRGADYVFTDGGLDSAVELAAALSGQSLRALSLMGGATNPRELYLRTRGVTNASDRALLGSGAADALRTWVRSHPEKAGTYAVQIGFELWRRDGRQMPECSGLVARPAGFARGEAERGAAAAREIAKRILALYESGNPDGIPDRMLRDAFLFAQWRLAVLARHRANAYDERKDTALAMEDTHLAEELDRRNGALDRIRATMAWASRKKLERMTPQEGLRMGLSQANFALARVFALRVLDISPDDPAANFAVGMDYFVQKQYTRAQAYLERCRKLRPDDPAVLNNIAQCRLRLGDPAGALPYAERAKEILPDSPEITRTLERVKSALAEQNRQR